MRPSTDARIPVIYVLSNGRSGSTLLDMLLGQQPEIWTLGEAQILPWELRENRRPCGCGTAVQECRFWKPILPKIPIGQGDYPIEHFRERHNSGRVVRWPHLLEILRRRQSASLAAASEEYGQLNASYFTAVWQAVQEHTQGTVRWLVDASKDMYRFFWLQRSCQFDLWVIHLVKDPRAFVYSMVKGDPTSWRRSIRFAARWLIQNSLYSHICADGSLQNRTLRIRYENLASEPADTLGSIGEWLGADFSDASCEGFRTYENHAISGNPMRWQETQIQLDTEWLRQLPTGIARLVWMMTGPLARSYGYLGGDPASQNSEHRANEYCSETGG